MIRRPISETDALLLPKDVQHAPECDGRCAPDFVCEDCGGIFGSCCGAADDCPECCDDCANARHEAR